jgi:hypothetical protein
MSFFSNSNGNRRIKSGGNRRGQSLLEVSTARPAPERRTTTRGGWSSTLKVLLALSLIAIGIFGGRVALNKLVWENPMYQLSDIRVSTDGLLTRLQVLEIMEIEEGRNIFSIDLAKARAALDVLPQVERLEVRRILPDRIDIRISERQPVAWVAKAADAELGLNSGAYLVDTRGYVMRMRKVMPEHFALPIITGVVMEDVAPGQKLPTSEALAALELIRASVDDVRWQPRVVDVSKGYCLVVTDQRKAKITFGFENIEGQLSRLRQLIDFVEPMQKEFQSVNLMLERNVPVTFVAQAPPPAPVDPKNKSKLGPSKTPATLTAPSSVSSPTSSQAISAQPSSAQPVSSANTSGGVVGGGTPVSTFMPAPIGSTSSFATSAPAGGGRSEASAVAKPVATPTVRRTVAEPSSDEPAIQKVKPKTRKVVAEKKDEDEDAPRPPKVERVQRVERADPAGERAVESSTKPKIVPVNIPLKTKERSVPADPVSVPPSEALRKLFNPHG